MNEIKLETISKIPFLSRNVANTLVGQCLYQEKYLEELLEYICFVDADVANKTIEIAIKNNVSLEKVLIAINPFVAQSLCDHIVELCIQKGISADKIVEKAFPFVSMNTADELARYALREECMPENLLNAAPPFVTAHISEKIFEYAFSKKVDPKFFSNLNLSMLHPRVMEMVEAYLNKSQNKETDELKLRLIKVFNESGVFLNPDDINEPLQLDSLHYISIICEIENEFDIEIPDEVLSVNILSTFQDFLSLLQRGDIKNEL